jgi:hypothetical protein
MAEEFRDPIEAKKPRSNMNIFLVVILMFVIMCCCCCALVAGFYYGFEPALQLLGIPIPW